MTVIEVKVPNLGDSKDVEIIEVHVAVGDTVKAEGTLITIETDKAVWLQGRAAWTFATLYNTIEKRPEWLAASKHCLDFIRTHCRGPGGALASRLPAPPVSTSPVAAGRAARSSDKSCSGGREAHSVRFSPWAQNRQRLLQAKPSLRSNRRAAFTFEH